MDTDIDIDKTARRPHVVVVGAGFAGLNVVKALEDAPVEITVLDRANHHLFQPLLYQVATAVLSPSDVAVPIRHVLQGENVKVLLAEVLGIDLDGRRVRCAHGEIGYDLLVLATGATHSYFGHEEWAARAPGLKTVDDALQIRRRILAAFEAAERESDPARKRAWLTFAVVGGGPTGVELAGALAEIARGTLPGEFRTIDPRAARVVLVEAMPRLLGAYPEPLAADAARRLERLGVVVRTEAPVTAIDEDGVTAGGQRIAARTVLWSAGVQASPLGRALGLPVDRVGRVKVTAQLTVPGHDEVFVIGDLACVDGGAVPAVAPAAIQQGRHAASNIRRRLCGLPPGEFRYDDRGTLAVIGRGAAVGVLFGRVRVRGLLAWLAWLAIHIAFLVGFRNRLWVLLGWAYSFASFKRQARLITGGALGPPAPRERPAPPGRAAIGDI
jgi:NADH:quinone reductase (non-electrogenic)